jgi:hypothetical protein
VTVTVYGQGFSGYAPWACQGADSDTIWPSSDTQAGGQVHVSQSATSVTICAGLVSYGPIQVTPSGGGDPTPNITSVTSDPSPPWQAGSQYAFSVDGTGFGTNPNVVISQGGATYYNDFCSGSGCDTHFAGWVTIPSDAPTGQAMVQVLSHGYTGNGFLGDPGQEGSNQWPEDVMAGAAVTPAELVIVKDCYWPNGVDYTVGYTRDITYRVVGAAPQHQQFVGSLVPNVWETVVRTSGTAPSGGGMWKRSENTIDPHGVFLDRYSANGNPPGTADQQYFATGNPYHLLVNIGGGQPGTLANSYSTTMVHVNGTTAPQQCQ